MKSRRRPAQAPSTTDFGVESSLDLGVLSLRSPRFPARRLPGSVQRVLPQPFQSLEEWRRYELADLDELTATEREFEACQLRLALAVLRDYDDVPTWLLRRLRALEAVA